MSSNFLKLLVLFFFALELQRVQCNQRNPSDFDNMKSETFRNSIKDEFKNLNLSIDNAEAIYTVKVDEFCNGVKNLSFSNLKNNSLSINYVATKVFKDHNLCLIVCTESLNKFLWPYCGAIKNNTKGKLNVSRLEPSSSKSELKKLENSLPYETSVAVNSNLSNLPSPTEKVSTDQTQKSETQQKKVNNSSIKADVPSEKTLSSDTFSSPDNIDDVNEETHYFFYFVVVSILCIVFYIAMYNKKKILALMIEGRKYKDKRRPTSAGYRKLNTNLEEVMPLGNSPPSLDSLIY